MSEYQETTQTNNHHSNSSNHNSSQANLPNHSNSHPKHSEGTESMHQNVPQHILQQLSQRKKDSQQFTEMMNKFSHEPFFSREFYYIISTKWLHKWKRYVGLEEETTDLMKLHDREKPKTINANIINYDDQIIFDDDDYQHYNIPMIEQLVEEKDFIYFPQQLWKFFKNKYQSYELKRYVVENNQGKQVQLYYQKVHLIPIFQSQLKKIQAKKLNKFFTLKFQFSKFAGMIDFKKAITPVIKKELSELEKGLTNIEKLKPQNCRVWFLDAQVTQEKLLNILEKSMRQSLLSWNDNQILFFQGTHINREKNFYQYDIPPVSLFVYELQCPEWCFFNKRIANNVPCPNCKKKTNLREICSCKNIAYCSENCKKNNFYAHKLKCKNPGIGKVEVQKKQPLTMKNGRIGLTNLGNTCFMNSGIQCLSNIKELTSYFTNDEHFAEINRQNPLGTKGRLSTAYANLMKKMWCTSDGYVTPSELKREIGYYQPIFVGYNQHDSGELITYLLDGLHEDLNRIKTKPYIENKDYDGREEKIVAEEQWGNFLKRNRSIIVDNLYGQYRSTLDCLKCSYRSIQFDPFLMCSLPIPLEESYKKIAIMLYKNIYHEDKIVMTFRPSERQTFQSLIEDIKNQEKITSSTNFLIFRDTYLVRPAKKVQDIKTTYISTPICIRALEEEERLIENKLTIFVLLACKSITSTIQVGRYVPYIFDKNKTAKSVYNKIFSMYKDFTQAQDFDHYIEKNQKCFIKLLYERKEPENCIICKKNCSSRCEFPYDDKKISEYVTEKDVIQLKLVLTKKQDEVKRKINERKSGKEYQITTPGIKLNLDTCFSLFQSVETLDDDNKWYCPKCKEQVRAKKQMKIYKAPKILLLCLKRFKRKRYYSEKNQTFIRFPHEFDLTKHLINPNPPQINGAHEQMETESVKYQLFAVSNHVGGTGSGHYTAYGKNFINNRWYSFNDSSVRQIDGSAVQTPNAYVLFYKRS